MRASYLHFERQYDAANAGAMELEDFEFSDEKTCPNLDSVLTAYFAGSYFRSKSKDASEKK